jgi:uncharacterized membrane protein YheB (UPF0754 family)
MVDKEYSMKDDLEYTKREKMLKDNHEILLMTTYNDKKTTISDLIGNERDNYTKKEFSNLSEKNLEVLGSKFLRRIIQKMQRTYTAWTDHDNWRESMPVPFPDNHSDWVEHHSD